MAISTNGIGLAATSAGLAPILSAFPEHLPMVAFAGVCGGASRWVAKREGWRLGLRSLSLGTASAVFLWPIAIPLAARLAGPLEMDPATALLLGGYVSGLAGVFLVGLFVDLGDAPKGGGNGESNE